MLRLAHQIAESTFHHDLALPQIVAIRTLDSPTPFDSPTPLDAPTPFDSPLKADPV